MARPKSEPCHRRTRLVFRIRAVRPSLSRSAKTLQELQRAVPTSNPGYDIHHIVERTSAEQDGFPPSVINAPENLVRIPRFKHWEITGWYMKMNESFGGISPRDYLRGKTWPERIGVGLDALIRHGVLKP